jgi:hypothetical protein
VKGVEKVFVAEKNKREEEGGEGVVKRAFQSAEFRKSLEEQDGAGKKTSKKRKDGEDGDANSDGSDAESNGEAEGKEGGEADGKQLMHTEHLAATLKMYPKKNDDVNEVELLSVELPPEAPPLARADSFMRGLLM